FPPPRVSSWGRTQQIGRISIDWLPRGRASRRLPDQHLGSRLISGERSRPCPAQADGIAGGEGAGPLQRRLAMGYEDVNEWSVGHADDLPTPEPAGPEHGAPLTNRDGRGVTATRSDGHEPAPLELAVDVELLVAGPDPRRIGRHPHLDEVNVS